MGEPEKVTIQEAIQEYTQEAIQKHRSALINHRDCIKDIEKILAALSDRVAQLEKQVSELIKYE